MIFQILGYTPSHEQEISHYARGFHGHRVKKKATSGGEQAGKSLEAAMDGTTWTFFPRSDQPGIGWVVAPTYEQGRPEMRYMLSAFGQLGMIESASTPTSPGPWSLTTRTGARWRVLSSEDVTKIANEAPDWILMVEAGQQPEEAYWRCLGRTGPKDALFSINGTLEGSTNWYAQLIKSWLHQNDDDARAFKLPSWSNLSLYPGGRQDPKILELERALPRHVFEERLGGNPVPPKGLVFPEFSHLTHVRPIQFGGRGDDTALILPEDQRLQLWVDPGYAGGYAVLAVAIHQDVVYLVDEIYTQYLITKEVIDIALTRPWWDKVDMVVMDVAGEQHQAQVSVADTWRVDPPHGAGVRVVGKPVGIVDGIVRTQSFLRTNPLTKQPQLFVSTKCPKTIWEFTDGYRRKLDKNGEIDGEKPVDKNNHAAKAVAYGLVYNFGLLARPELKIERDIPLWEQRHRDKRKNQSSLGWSRWAF